MRRLLLLALGSLLVAGAVHPALAVLDAPTGAVATPTTPGQAWAGVASADATWNVGSAAGQYAGSRDVAGEAQGGGVDPNFYSVKDQPSYGVQSRLSIRALVVQGANGTKVALVKADNYLAQDLLQRRVEQLLDPGLGITRHNLVWSATHDHSSPYDLTPAVGVAAFQDVFDLRMFEYEARQAALAITDAATHLRPVSMGATRVHHEAFKGNIVGPQIADDGTPAGYPKKFGDFDLTVMRFDDLTNPTAPKPLATWVNWGQHPESLDKYGLITADYLSALQRDVDRATGSTMVFSQGDVGSSEGPYDHTFSKPEQLPDGVYREWAHMGYAQMERGASELAGSVIDGWRQIGSKQSLVKPSTTFPVGVAENWVPGPVSHPYPSVSNCRTQPSVDGDPGAVVIGLPDCQRGGTGVDAPIWEAMRAAGAPVPDHYDAPGFGGVEENLRIHLQAVRLGDVLLASCSCEAQVDLILNLKSRTDAARNNIWDGFPWDQYCDAQADGSYRCANPQTDNPADRSLTVSKAAFDHMKAEIHNDAAGWDAPTFAVDANSESTDPSKIKGNFTKQELQDVCATCTGYVLPVGLGHTGDYDGYTVSYREYMSRDSYRKALTSYGAHTADYMVTRLVKMAASLQGGPAVAPEINDATAQVDEQRQQAFALALGKASSAAYDGWQASLPDDVGPARATVQPKSIKRFDAATFSWTGGSNAIDNPRVTVERLVGTAWTPVADQSGEVQTFLELPSGFTGVADQRTGTQEWRWRANFEAFDPFPVPTANQVVDGTYHFVVKGVIHQGGGAAPYSLTSEPFTVSPWDGITVTDGQIGADGSVSFVVPPFAYPRSYQSTAAPAFVKDDNRTDVCKTCTFRPWASGAPVQSVKVLVTRKGGKRDTLTATLMNGRWVASAGLRRGDTAVVAAGGVRDAWGETNALASTVLRGT
jgi:hypothetical protein